MDVPGAWTDAVRAQALLFFCPPGRNITQNSKDFLECRIWSVFVLCVFTETFGAWELLGRGRERGGRHRCAGVVQQYGFNAILEKEFHEFGANQRLHWRQPNRLDVRDTTNNAVSMSAAAAAAAVARGERIGVDSNGLWLGAAWPGSFCYVMPDTIHLGCCHLYEIYLLFQFQAFPLFVCL